MSKYGLTMNPPQRQIPRVKEAYTKNKRILDEVSPSGEDMNGVRLIVELDRYM